MQNRPLYKRLARYRLELFSSFGVILWGSFLLNPFTDTFVRFPNYAEMAKHANEDIWGIVAILIGLCSLSGTYTNSKRLRYAGMLGVLIFRTFTLMLVGLQTKFTSPGTGDFLLWAIMALVAYYRIDNEF